MLRVRVADSFIPSQDVVNLVHLAKLPPQGLHNCYVHRALQVFSVQALAAMLGNNGVAGLNSSFF